MFGHRRSHKSARPANGDDPVIRVNLKIAKGRGEHQRLNFPVSLVAIAHQVTE